MKYTLSLIFSICFLIFSCKGNEIENVIKKDIVVDKSSQENRQCINTVADEVICDDFQIFLSGEVTKIETKRFKFIATPVEYNGNIAVSKPRPLSVDMSDFEGFKNNIDKNELNKVINSKVTYHLEQDSKKFFFRSYKVFDIKLGNKYIFNAVLYRVTTLDHVKNIIFIEDYKIYEE